MKVTDFPDEIDILGVPYKIEYCDNPSNVDIQKRESMWGQIDFWTKTIRIYMGNNHPETVWHTLWHEILHAITDILKIKWDEDKDEEIVDLLSLGINSIVLKYFEYVKPKKKKSTSKKK